jgi:hypothetical protein
MNNFDSLGARQEPLEDEIVGFDWQGEPLFQGEMVYFIEHEFVREDDLKNYIEKNVGKPVMM